MRKHFIVGSRQSQLALIQTQLVIDSLIRFYHDNFFEIKKMSTKGDQVLDVALSKIGDKGLFTHELETAIAEGSVDFAVHSLKDLPTKLPPFMVIGAITKREIENDVLIFRLSHPCKSLSELPPGSVIGSSSLRRIAQLKMMYPKLVFKDIRGNLNTRFKKLDDISLGYDAIILAHAGVKRLGPEFETRISAILEDLYWAPGQGALAIETREGNEEVLDLLKCVHDKASAAACISERSFLEALGGGCQIPLGVKSKLSEDQKTLYLSGRVLNLDGTKCVEGEVSGDMNEPIQLGQKLALILKEKGAHQILQEVRNLTSGE